MIEEQAQVVEVRGDQLVLQAQTQSACGSCSASKGCGTSVLSKVVGRKFTRFQAENNIDAEVGDTVIVGISEDALLKGSVVMYVIPILGMLFFALAADYLLTAIDYRDLAISASGIMGLVFGSLMSRWYFQRQSSAQSFTPVVLRKIIGHGKL
ncbi:MAG: Fis family transcriptional regulator [Gammaproteobacteria bacterium]|nr:Fis family transcriptional regulator [Gammaproteobacteria bacterium]